MRRTKVQIAILVLSGATLLDDGPFLVVAALTATVALVLCGSRRLMAAADAVGRRSSARDEPAQTSP